VEELLEAEQRRMSSLFTDLKVRRVDTAELVEQDPQLLSFLNVNHPEDYLQALELAGFQLDIEIEARLAAEQGGAS
jgi:molybdopterin-guanine dinucleotide biosynthesis protein A